MLIARNREKLEAVAQTIREQFGVQVQIVVFDFCSLCSVAAVELLA